MERDQAHSHHGLADGRDQRGLRDAARLRPRAHPIPGSRARLGDRRLPFAVPTLVAGVMLVALYGPNSAVGGWFEDHGVQIIFAPPGILLALLFVTLPLVVRSVQPVLLELDRAEEEAAQRPRRRAGGRRSARSCCPRSARRSRRRAARSPGAWASSARSSSSRGTSRIRRSRRRCSSPSSDPRQFGSTAGPIRPRRSSALLFGLAFLLVLLTEKLMSVAWS